MAAEADDLLRRCSFAFDGTVREVKASAVNPIPAADDTVIVRVERMVKGVDTRGQLRNGWSITSRFQPFWGTAR